MKLKELREKRESIINELETMVSALESEGEVRALSEEERAKFAEKKAEVESIDATISLIEETRAKAVGETAVVELKEERSKEVRAKEALDKFLRGKDLEGEERAMLSTTGNNQAFFPVEIVNTILQKLEEMCPVMDMARTFNTKGTLRLIKEDTYGNAGLTAENGAFTENDPAFDTVELRAYKVTAMVSATFEMLANSEIDLSSYLLDVITRRLSKEINKLFICGTGVNQPQGLINGGIPYALKSTDALTINDFIMMQTAMNPAYLDGAVWIVNRSVFQKMASLLDGVGRPYLTTSVIDQKIQYSLLGLKVIVDENMDGLTGKHPIMLANIGECYIVNVVQEITIRHLVEMGFANGLESYAGYVLIDGRISNDLALVVANVGGATPAPAPSK